MVPFNFCSSPNKLSIVMPLLNLVPPPKEKDPYKKVSPGESHDVSLGSRLYSFQSGEWIVEPNQSPPLRGDLQPIFGDVIKSQEVPAREITHPLRCPQPSMARSLSRSEIHELHSEAEEIKMCVDLCELINLNPHDYKFSRFGSYVLQNFGLSILREDGAEFSDDCICLIAEHSSGDVYVVVRGSSSYSQIQSNLQAVTNPSSTEKMYIHERFLHHAMHGLEPQIRLRLQHIEHLDRIYVTGHGSGAAVASIVAYLVANTFGRIPVHCVTFGSPIPGDAAFSRCLKDAVKKHYRVVLDTDIMPLLPVGQHLSQCGEALCVRYSGTDPPDLEIWPEMSDSRWTFSVSDVIQSINHTPAASVSTYRHQVCLALSKL